MNVSEAVLYCSTAKNACLINFCTQFFTLNRAESRLWINNTTGQNKNGEAFLFLLKMKKLNISFSHSHFLRVQVLLYPLVFAYS